jgi:hypothetical protein
MTDCVFGGALLLGHHGAHTDRVAAQTAEIGCIVPPNCFLFMNHYTNDLFGSERDPRKERIASE